MTKQFETSSRYRQIWEASTQAENGAIIATIEEPYVEGSLRPQITSLCAEIGGVLVHLTNGETAFMADDESVLAKLTALEELQAS